jgi:hypothetical protein
MRKTSRIFADKPLRKIPLEGHKYRYANNMKVQ